MDKSMALGGGGRFAKMTNDVAEGYMKKGMSSEEAHKIGAATAAKAGMKRYGKEHMAQMAQAGKRRVKRYKKA